MACLCACKNKQQKLEADIKPILMDIVKRDSLVSKIDSLIIIRVDTLTDIEYAQQRSIHYNAMASYYHSMLAITTEELDLKLDQAKRAGSVARSFDDLSAQLANTYRENSKEYIKDAKKIQEKCKMYVDSESYFIRKDSIIARDLKYNKVDKKTFRGYIARFKLTGADKKNIYVKKDSMYAYISPQLRIIPVSSIR